MQLQTEQFLGRKLTCSNWYYSLFLQKPFSNLKILRNPRFLTILHPHHTTVGPLCAKKYALKIRTFFPHMLMRPFAALRIKTDFKIFSESFIGKKIEMYDWDIWWNWRRKFKWVFKYVLNGNHFVDFFSFLLCFFSLFWIF